MTYKGFKTISSLDVKGKKVLLRVDLNSEIINKKPIISQRIIEHAKTIKELKKRQAKVIIIAHQSRKGKKDFTSLREHSKLLNRLVKVKFVHDIIGKKAEKEITNLKKGEAILLENIRFLKEEYKPTKDNKIINFFKDKIEIYINDAFSICHRNETSIVSLPKIIKEKAIGRVLENELKQIEKIKVDDENTLFILGGNKVEDIILLINKKNILSTGVLALLCLKSKGQKLGLEDKILREEEKFILEIKRNLKNIKVPKDMAININGKREEIDIGKFPVKYEALDIGKETIKFYEEEISKADKIFWKGTAGDCSRKEFCLGTKRLLKAMENSKAFCIVAGGHSGTEVDRYKINKDKLGYVSLSGGSLVHYIAKKRLPGLEALKIR